MNQSHADPLVVVEDQERPLIWVDPVDDPVHVRTLVFVSALSAILFICGLLIGFALGAAVAASVS